MDFKDLLQNIDEHQDTVYLYHTDSESIIPMHKHKKHQMSYIEGGVAYLYTPEKSFFLPARHFVWIPAESLHYIEFKTHTSNSIDKNIYFPSCMTNEHATLEKIGIYPVTNLLFEMILFTVKWNGNIWQKDIFKFQFTETLRNVVSETSEHPISLALPTTTNNRVIPVLRYINMHIDQPLYLKEVAEAFGFSSRSLSRLFRDVLMVSFLQYVTLSRIIKSMELLLGTELSISEIAYQMGYSSVATYSNIFLQLVNTRPAEFRRTFR